jgi:diguanylate cyclase (GGDEF)-like protein
VNEPVSPQPARPKLLLLGDASARPEGLERALTRAGFQLVERVNAGSHPSADAILITLSKIDDAPLQELLPTPAPEGTDLPRLVLIASGNPDGLAAVLTRGAADAMMGPVHLPELCARLYARIRERRQSQSGVDAAEAAVAAGSDPETETLEHRVQEEFERARRYSLSFSLVLLGIDELQGADQRLGEEAAGRLRHEVGRTLRRELRVPDLVVPYGTDEFAIVLPETGQAGARQSVVRVRERLTSLPFEGDPRLEASRFSAGIVTYPHPAAFQPDDLFAMAEAALMRGRAQSTERIGMAV